MQSSGGGPGEPTWFLNPQFRLAVPTHTTIVLTVAQFDPKVRGRTHKLVPAGLVVVRTKKNHFPSRIWNMDDHSVVGEQVPVLARDVSITVRLLPDSLYYVVPYSLPGVQAPFLLRLYSSGVVELQRAGPPQGQTVRGQWVSPYCGGKRGHASFFNNPQFNIKVPRLPSGGGGGGNQSPHARHGHEADEGRQRDAPEHTRLVDVDLILRRIPPAGGRIASSHQSEEADESCFSGSGGEETGEEEEDGGGMRAADRQRKGGGVGGGGVIEGGGIKGNEYVAGGCIGMCVVKCGDRGSRLVSVLEEQVVAESLYELKHVAKLSLQLRRGGHYKVIPSIESPGMEGAYTLECFSDESVQLEKVAHVRCKTVSGEWRGATAGGSHLNTTWSDNPQYYLYVPPPVATKPQIRIVLKLLQVLILYLTNPLLN